MCALGLYLAFLVLEDMIVGNYTINSTRTHNLNITNAYNIKGKDFLKHKNVTKRSISKQNILLNSSTIQKPITIWQMWKVTPEQYGTINRHWRKNKFLIDWSSTRTTKTLSATNIPIHKHHIPLTFSTSLPHRQATTSSKIEFYYMDEKQPTVNKKHSISTAGTSHLPFMIFHLKGPFVDSVPISSSKRLNQTSSRNEQVRISGIRLKEVRVLPLQVTSAPILVTKKIDTTVNMKTIRSIQLSLRKDDFFDSNALMKRAIPPPPTSNSINILTASCKHDFTYSTKSSTIYDKIKFFEIHDKYTRVPVTKTNLIQVNHRDGNIIDNDEKILLEHVNQGSHEHDQAKHAKKHISEPLNFNELSKNHAVAKLNILQINDTHKTQLNGTSMKEKIKSEQNNSNSVPLYVSETVHWSEYPFTAVYIYEPSQVHCDAAAINTHWLIASGSCLSRVSKMHASFESYGENQSAFVAYCGELWWEPERVAYVKYTVVHPRYHPRDKTRQHLYNIGAIQVVNSLASACAGWAPVPLMSHQFVTNAENTKATAIGWGLDRFDTRYGTTDLPKTPLMLYKSVVYFDSCPGNVGYSKAKGLEEGGGVSNVHCLSLPPYYGEKTDPVHGGLLLANGKFIAFYLQEERRPWGNQCAQYTGVWRLIPWLMDIAKEPEEIDNFMFEL